MKLDIKPDCTDSPLKELVKNLTIWFVSYDLEQVAQHLHEQVAWTMAGDQPVVGREAFIESLKEWSHNKATELVIHSIISQDNEVAVNGEMLMMDGNRFAFADFYEFSHSEGGVVKGIISYVVKMG
ncbi:MAG: nuclear transport factor 2 family protein [Bacteroidia bacterium]|nr:nuclear transport factor 2 family protein [Bacteroidia bacterium]